MTLTNDFSIESIIKKYEHRQQQLTTNNKDSDFYSFQLNNNKLSIDFHKKTGASTPQFTNITNRKQRKESKDEYIQKTHKKNEFYQTFMAKDVASSNFNVQIQKKQYQKILAKLDQTQQKLTRSEKNYADIWRKYEKLLKQGQKSEKQIEIQYRLKQKQVQEQRIKLESYDRQIKNLKQCLQAKESNISALKDKLSEKSLKMVQTERAFQTLKSQFQLVKAKQQKIEEKSDNIVLEKDRNIIQLKEQLQKFEGLLNEKEKQKKKLLLQMQKNYISHKEQLQILRISYQKVEQEYKQWIQSCNKQKLTLIESYQTKIKQNAKNVTNSHFKASTLHILEQQAAHKTQQITFLIAQSLKLTNELKSVKIQLENSQKVKLQLIGKFSSLQNGMIEKIQYNKTLENSYKKLQNLYKSQQQKNKQLSSKYNLLNKQFLQLKAKCSILFSEMQEKKQFNNTQAIQIIKFKKEIMICKQQIQRSRNNEMNLNNKLNQSMKILKNKSSKHDQEKEEIMTDLLAQRLENAKLRQQLKQTKQVLQKEYQLSLQNLRKQIQEQIKGNTLRPLTSNCDVQKQQLYLQLRQLQRRYQLLASEVVTVDQMISLSNKVQRRYQNRK